MTTGNEVAEVDSSSKVKVGEDSVGDTGGRIGDVDVDRAGVGGGLEDAQGRGPDAGSAVFSWMMRGPRDAAAFIGDERVVRRSAASSARRREHGVRGRVVDLERPGCPGTPK